MTFRVVGFFILLLAVLAGGYYLLQWYANDDWYVTLQHNQSCLPGHPGGVLWFKPKLVDRTGVEHRRSAVHPDPRSEGRRRRTVVRTRQSTTWTNLHAGKAGPASKSTAAPGAAPQRP